MGLRSSVVLVLAVALAAVQMFAIATGGPRIDDANAAVAQPGAQQSRSVAAQDNDDEDNEDSDNEDSDNEDSDNEDSDNDDEDDDDEDDDSDNEDGDNDEDNDDSDNEDGDNDEDSDNDDSDNDDSDNEDADEDDESDEDLDNVGVEDDDEPTPTPGVATTTGDDDGFAITTPASTPTPSTSWSQMPPALPSPSPSPSPLVEARAVTTGADLWVSLPGDRVGVQVFPSTPPNITLTVRMVDPLAYPPAPGIRAGDLIFLVDAVDASGYTLAMMPAEARLTLRYTAADVAGLDVSFLTLSRLDAATGTWLSVPNVVIDPVSNYLETPLNDTGVYVLSVPDAGSPAPFTPTP